MARSRGELEEIIKRGECVLLQDGRVITDVADLPSAIELAGDDIVKKQQAVADLEEAAKKALSELEDAKTKAKQDQYETDAREAAAKDDSTVVNVGRKEVVK